MKSKAIKLRSAKSEQEGILSRYRRGDKTYTPHWKKIKTRKYHRMS